VTFTNVSLSNRAPTVSTAAVATPAAVTGTSTALSVIGADDHGETNLRYTWSADVAPADVAAPTFSDNGTNAGRNSTATFAGAGTYVLRVTVADASGLTATSTVTVVVTAVTTGLAITPAGHTMFTGESVQFSAKVVDQFGNVLDANPDVDWFVTDGTMNTAGRFTAPAAPGTVSVAATSGVLIGDVEITVLFQDVTGPSLVSAASRKTHGARGAFDLPLALAGTTATVEPRRGGLSVLRLVFDEPLLVVDGLLDASEFSVVNAAFESAELVNSGAGAVLTLNLANTLDRRLLTVALIGLSDLTGNGMAGDIDVSVRCLFGDVDGNGVVSARDYVAARSGVYGGAWNYLLDVDASGTVSSRDVLFVRTRSGNTVLS
jgi:hypothetical protein